MTASVGWGLVGCGWVGRDFVLPALAASANGHVVALCDPDPRALATAAAACPDALATPDLDELLATPGVDAVHVATPNAAHRPVVEAVAAAGRAVLCEKPLAADPADAAAMAAACRAAGVPAATAFDQRFHAAHRRLAALVAEGALGTVTSARTHYACWLPADWRPSGHAGAYDNWRVDPVRAGGGALVDLAPHGLDLLQVVLGDELVDLVAFTQRAVHDYAVDDGAVLAGRFAGGAVASLHVAYNCPERFPRRVLEVVGTEAMAVATDTMGQEAGGRLELVDAGSGERTAVPLPPEDDRSPFLAQAEAFAASMLDGLPFPYPMEADVRLVERLAAACR